jgi:asparagine synthase (glutamine-hydrolysing)
MENAVARDLIARMLGVIEHRGPDDGGHYIEPGVGLGMRRLAIIDLATGRQPISNEDGSIWIVFNGEIYNYRELRELLLARGHKLRTRTDTETIAHLYEDEGERCVERLRGMFAFAIWDRRERRLFLARDRVGKKPLHYALAGGTLVFGSEIKSLLQHPGVKREINLQAISDFLSFGYVPDPSTAFAGVFKLPPGHTLTFKDGLINTRRYWDFDYSRDPGGREPELREEDYIERLRELIAESVRVRLESEVPLGAFLSGGIDSSVVVAMMARQMGRPVKTFSIGFSDADFDELRYARIAARHFGADHHEFVVTPDVCRLVEEIVWHHDEPFADVSSVPTYVVSKMAREHVTVALSGDGGDEVFAGYERYVVDRRRRRYERIPAFLRPALLRASQALPQGAYGKRFLRNIALEPAARYVDSVTYFDRDSQLNLFSEDARRALAGYDPARRFERTFAASAARSRLERLLYLDSKTYLPGDILVKVDRMSMANSLETRSPLLDHRLIEFAQTIPASLKLRGLETKYILKRAAAGLIPEEIINRPKQGFDVPIRLWFNRELRELLDDTLNDRRLRERGDFNHRAALAILDEHRRGVRDNSRRLWGLLTLELWRRAFIDRQPEMRFTGAKSAELDHLAENAAATVPIEMMKSSLDIGVTGEELPETRPREPVKTKKTRLKKPRVLHLITSFEVGGTERQAVELLKRIDRRRFDVGLAALRLEGPLYQEVAPILPRVPQFPLTSFYNANAAKQLMRLCGWMIRERADILHAHDFYAGLLGAAAARLASVRVIACQRHMRLSDRRVHEWGTRLTHRLAHRVLVNSEAIRDHLLAGDYIAPEKIVVIHNGLSAAVERAILESGGRAKRRAALLRELNLDGGAKLIGLVARLQLVKGHRYFIEAAGRIAAVEPKAHFLLVGDGALRREIEEQAARVGVNDRVHLLGARNDAALIAAGFDVAVSASLSEGLPNAVMEAMAAGAPVVATAVGGTTELVIDDATGFLAPPADADALARRILDALQNPEWSARMAAQGRRRVLGLFSMRRMVESVEELYDEIYELKRTHRNWYRNNHGERQQFSV